MISLKYLSNFCRRQEMADLSKLSNAVKNDVVKKSKYNELSKKVSAVQTTDTSNLVKRPE